MTLLDVTRTDDRHTSERLSAEPIIWLGTVRPDGRPRNVPVWFAWHDPMVLIFSMPKTAKVRNVRLSPAVSLALDSADGGQDIVLAEGRAELIAGDNGTRTSWPGSSGRNTLGSLAPCPLTSGVRRSPSPS